MSSLFKSTLNTRALPIGGLHYIRSDVPLWLTDVEIQWYQSHHKWQKSTRSCICEK